MSVMTDEPGKRLKALREKKGFATAADAARAYGWPITTYQAHENSSRGIKLEAARRYASVFNSTAAFILTGQGGNGTQPIDTVLHIPVIARASAGAFRYDDGIDEGSYLVPAAPRGDIAAAVQYGVIVDGQSVNKRIPDGAYAICAPYDSYPGGAQHGQLVHVVRERAGLHEHTIKELRFTGKGMQLVPCSTDPKHQEAIDLSAPEEDTVVRIVGVVIGVFQPL